MCLRKKILVTAAWKPRGRMIEDAASKIGNGQIMWGIWGLSVCQGIGKPLYDVMYGGEMIQCAFLNAH